MKKQILKGTIFALSLSTLILMSTGCSTGSSTQNADKESTGSEATSITLKDGTYEGVGIGNRGEVKVSVTIAEGKISEVKVTDHHETDSVGGVAVEILPGKIVEAQSTEVDTVSGATVTSKAIIDGVSMALEQAK